MTSSDLAAVEESSLTVLPPAQHPAAAARQMLREHAAMMQDARHLAAGMVRTEMVPKRFQGEDKVSDAAAAILYGAELGLNPIQSLQRIIPIHGMPSLESRTMVALLKSRGYKIRTVEQSDISVTVQGVDLNGDTYESTWTIDRARMAGYVPEPAGPDSLKRPNVKTDWVTETKSGRNGTYHVVLGNMKYITDPQAMLKAKAQSEVSREMAPDVLMGISYTSEDLYSENWDRDPVPVQASRGRSAPVTTDDILNDEPITVAEVTPEAEPEPEPKPEPEPESAADEAQQAEPEPASEPEPAEEAVPVPVPEPENVVVSVEPEPEPAPEEKPKTQTRKALERRLFKLLKDADIPVENREDRLIVYRFIVGRDTVNSTDDLNDVEVAKVCDSLYDWQQKKQLGDKVTEILNTATLAQDDA